MNKIIKKSAALFAAIVLILILLATSAAANEVCKIDEYGAGEMTADIAFVRPLGIVSIAFGSIMFALSLPFSAPAGNVKEVYCKMIVEPAKFTFTRPVGDFSSLE